MKPRTGRRPASAALFAVAISLGGCVVTPAGYDADGGVDYVGGIYEPYGIDYGGWGRGYYPGPPRGGMRGHDGPARHYRAAAPGRAAPSIPGGSRGGGHGGAHPGGGHHQPP